MHSPSESTRGRRARVGLRSVTGGSIIVGLAALLGLVLAAVPALAAERTAADLVLVDETTVIADDLYAAGNRIVVEGRIDGDLVASAFADVVISGTVTGDVMVVAGSVTVTGDVGGSVRAVAPEVVVAGTVQGDVVTLGWEPGVAGSIDGDVLVWGWDATVGGDVGGDLEGQSRVLALTGTVRGGVDVTVDRLRVGEDAVVEGDLGYRSPHPSQEVDQAEVGGTVVHRSPLAANVRVRALFVLAKVLLGLMAAVVGLLVMWAVPGRSDRVAAAVRRTPVRSWLIGLAVTVAPLVVVGLAAVLLALTPTQAALPVLAVMAPVFLAVVGLVAAAGLVAPVAVYPVLGDLRAGARSPVRAFLLGAVVVTLLSLVPWLSWVVAVVVVPLGIGGWVRPRTADTVSASP